MRVRKLWLLGMVVCIAVVIQILLTAIPAPPAKNPCAQPSTLADGWQSSLPEDAGMEASHLCAALTQAGSGGANIHSVVVACKGRLVGELYRAGQDHPINVAFGLPLPFTPHAQFDPDTKHDMRSISKSIVSLLFGIAQSQGKIDKLSTPALAYYPEYANLRSSARDSVTLESLLTMSSGLQWDEGSVPDDETKLYWDAEPYMTVLGRPIQHPPGKVFNYNSGGTAVLANILTRSTGKSLRDLARVELFDPLGITDWQWVADPRGRELAFTGLRLRPRDMLKIGQMVADKGLWQGRQIVPAQWIEQSTAPHIQTGISIPPTAKHELHYGYQWWGGYVDWHGKSLAWSAGFGNGGQRVYIVPDLNLVVVITAGDYGSAPINRSVQAVFEEIVASVKVSAG